VNPEPSKKRGKKTALNKAPATGVATTSSPGAEAYAPQSAADAEARLRIRESIGESLIVEASAGTGKTTELVSRIVAVLKAGAKIDRIAAVTFTHKAAGEMKLRLRAVLDQQRHAHPVLEDALARLEEASIGTIHSFCAQILRERPVEARIDPGFEELTEQEGERVYLAAFRSWLEQRLGEDSPGLRRAFARLAYRDSWDDSPPLEQLQYAGRKLIEWRDYRAPWAREPFDRPGDIDSLVGLVMDLAAASARPRNVNDNLFKGLAPARALADSINRREGDIARTGLRDYDALESQLLKLGRDLAKDTRRGSGRYSEHITREDLVEKRGYVEWRITEFRRNADADLAAVLRQEMTRLVEEYEGRKRRSGKLDFVDLLMCVRNLVRDQQEVRAYLQRRFTHLFIDEFQDTDPLQAELLLLLAADDPAQSDWLKVRPAAGKLFVVGDPKQSIYKFRRADMVLYAKVRDMLVANGAGLVRLTQSFRSVPNLQRLINAAFAPEMTGDAESGQATWAPLEEARPEGTHPSAIVLPVPRPYGQRRVSKDAINRCLPDAIAAFVAWLVKESGWGFAERDVAILLRRRTQFGKDLTREYARALEARDVAHLLGATRSFHKREEVETLRAALTAIEWPDDELSVFATLKGSLFAIPDELLLRYRHQHHHLQPFAKLDEITDEAFAPIVEALSLIRELHRTRNRQSFSTTVSMLLEATRAHAGFVLRPGGQQVLANALRVVDLARSYEIGGGVSFRGFVEELDAQARKEDSADAPVLEQDSDGVRIMTVHSAKGLEFPVVILADITANIAAREPDQHVDSNRGLCAVRLLRCAPRELSEHEPLEAAREQAEGVRVAYVAATRARDLLVVPAVGDEAFEGWLSPLNKAIYPTPANARKSQPDARCPEFGAASVLSRPLELGHDEISIRPGRIQPATGDHEVIWWDPGVLQLGIKAKFGTIQKEILTRDEGGFDHYRAWQQTRNEVLQQAARPRFDVFTGSETDQPPPGAPEPVSILSARPVGATARPGGRRFGTLVHSVLRDVPFGLATSEVVSPICELHAKILGATEDESAAAIESVLDALGHPVIQEARYAEVCYREYPVTLHMEDGRLLDGVLDLAYRLNGTWVIVDFKTDADLANREAHYSIQLQWYCVALERITGIPARGVLLQI
jgi:ATP-dependent exoDNAse (exonuclease V) beta subunit